MSSTNDPTTLDDAALREALKRCSPATYYAACKFRQTGEREHLTALIRGVVERFVERERRDQLNGTADTLRLREDLGLDSLTMMEVVMLAEEVLQISVSNEELTRVCTLGDVQRFVELKLSAAAEPSLAHAAAAARASRIAS